MPTQVEIAIASLQRLIREEKSYHTELTQQRKQLTAMESGSMIDDEENKNFQLKQQVRVAIAVRGEFKNRNSDTEF